MGPERDSPGDAVTPSPSARYLSVALDLRDRRCLVVGGGAVAARKAQALLDAGGRVTLVAPNVGPEAEALLRMGSHADPGPSIELRRRSFTPADLDGAFLVMSATDDPELTERVAGEARARGVLINAADDPAHCDFILPAVLRRGDVQIGITTGGQSPALARHLRERLEQEIPSEYGPLAEALAVVRDELRQAGTRVSAEAWQQAINPAVLATLREEDKLAAIQQIRSALLQTHNEGKSPSSGLSPRGGQVILVGAGPGDPGLITVAGHRAIARADLIVYDRLINPALLDAARPDARLIYVGKARGGGPLSQGEINELICAEARSGSVVVRLKGGDPFVFGRGGEEALAAVEAGVPFTVIPGISAAVAAPAYAGIPVTHRGLASAFTVLTGHEDPAKPSTAVDWDSLAHFGGTLVLLMGVHTLPAITTRLLEKGLDPKTPAAVIERGTLERQRVVSGTVADIAEQARHAEVKAPATTIIGSVVGLADLLAWWQTTCPEPGPP